jgi:alpha-D-ribose 1-methylphosphonate 5-triphosphate synthase subunit PhnH
MFSGETIDGGFANPVFDGQSVFRAVMDAMARPGTVLPLAAHAAPPAPLSATAAAVALALCDHDTPVWLDPALASSDAVKAWLGFHTGAPLTDLPSEAAFAFAADLDALPALAAFGQGTQEYPDRSTTLVLHVETLQADAQALDQGASLLLEGPGIRTTASLAVAPLPRNFAEQWRENRARFPRGIDIVLTAPGVVACLPRSTRIRKG